MCYTMSYEAFLIRKNLNQFLTSIGRVEILTGLDSLTTLDDDIENEVEKIVKTNTAFYFFSK